MESYEQIELNDIMKIIWKNKIIIIAIILISILIGAYYTYSIIEPKYKSTMKILIDKNDASIEDRLTEADVIDGAVTQLADSSIDAKKMKQSIYTAFDRTKRTITITVIANNAQLAYNMNNAYLEPLRLKLEEKYNVSLYDIIEPANMPKEPYNINHAKDMIIAIGLGVILAGAYILIIVTNENVIRKGSTVEANGFILLGKIKRDKKNKRKTISYVIKDEKVQEELRRIIAKIEFNKNAERPKTILFTGIKEKVGNSYVVSNLAYKYAKQGKKVLVIDANLKNGMQHKIFNVNNEEGLTNLMASKQSINNINDYINKCAISNLYVLTQGVEKENKTLKVEVFVEILQKLQNDFDIILIDGMPILEEVLPIALANIVDATVIVTEYEKTKIKDLLNTKKLIEDINGRISGVIVNKT